MFGIGGGSYADFCSDFVHFRPPDVPKVVTGRSLIPAEPAEPEPNDEPTLRQASVPRVPGHVSRLEQLLGPEYAILLRASASPPPADTTDQSIGREKTQDVKASNSIKSPDPFGGGDSRGGVLVNQDVKSARDTLTPSTPYLSYADVKDRMQGSVDDSDDDLLAESLSALDQPGHIPANIARILQVDEVCSDDELDIETPKRTVSATLPSQADSAAVMAAIHAASGGLSSLHVAEPPPPATPANAGLEENALPYGDDPVEAFEDEGGAEIKVQVKENQSVEAAVLEAARVFLEPETGLDTAVEEKDVEVEAIPFKHGASSGLSFLSESFQDTAKLQVDNFVGEVELNDSSDEDLFVFEPSDTVPSTIVPLGVMSSARLQQR